MRALLTCGHWTVQTASGSAVKEGHCTRRWFSPRLRKATLTQEGEGIKGVNVRGLQTETRVDWIWQISYLPVEGDHFWTTASKAAAFVCCKALTSQDSYAQHPPWKSDWHVSSWSEYGWRERKWEIGCDTHRRLQWSSQLCPPTAWIPQWSIHSFIQKNNN